MTTSAARRGPLGISLAYIAFGALWILLSDHLLFAIAGGDVDLVGAISMGKGWAYVLGSGALLWGLVRQRERALSEQGDLLESVLDNIGDCVVVVDDAGRVTAMNPAARRLFGSPRNLGEWRTPDGDDPLPADEHPLERGLRGLATDLSFVLVRTRRYPEGRCLSVTGSPMWGRHGTVEGAVLVLRDVTDTWRDRQRLRASEALFHTVARLAPVGIFRSDAQGRSIYVNERWTELAGMSAEASMGTGWLANVHPDDRARVAAEWDRCVRERVPYRIEYRFRRSDDRVTWLQVEAVEEVDEWGDVVGYVGTMTDITARKVADDETRRHADELERRVCERTAQLVASSRELDAFSYTVSHDLRAPLRTISGFTQMALEEAGDTLGASARGHLARVVGATDRMNEIIDGLLNLGRVTRTPLRGEWVDISAVAVGISEELRAEDPDRRVAIEVVQGLRLWGDPTLLRIAVENLLRNAWKFTRGTPDARVVVGRAAAGEQGIVVRDNGAGFEMEFAAKLFKPFERLHPTSAFPGSGIGLATVHRIVTRHGGRVWAEGAVGAGATFGFTVAAGPA